MGGRSSKARVKLDEVKRLSDAYGYPKDEVSELYELYFKLVHDSSRKDGLPMENFHRNFLISMGESPTPFVEKLYRKINRSGGDFLLLEDLVAYVATMVKGPVDRRIEFVFSLYSGGLSSDKPSGYVTRSNLEEIVSGMFNSPVNCWSDLEVSSFVNEIFSRVRNDGVSFTFDDYKTFALANERIGATLGGVFWMARQYEKN